MYHGTEIERGRKIVQEQKFSVTVSTDRRQHWLGDGIYLYREILLAFRWIVMMFNARHKADMETELLHKYTILKASVECDEERIFRLDNWEHFCAFKKVEEEYKRKSELSPKLNKMECTDGMIINIMFKYLGYGNNYDMVEAIFPITKIDYEFCQTSRIRTFSEYQACIKNDSIIKNIVDISDAIDFKDYYKRYEDIEETKRVMSYKAKKIGYSVKGG